MVGNKNLQVGLFVAVALTILVVFTIWVTGKKGSEPIASYSILIENDVSGLMLGGPVFFLGVSVGEVTGLYIMADQPGEDGNLVGVRVDIEVLSSTPVDSSTWATLAAQGITGVSVINLSSDPELDKVTPLQTRKDIENPLIPFRDSGFSAILSSAPNILRRVEELLDRATEMLGEANQQSLQNTLANIESLSGSLSGQGEALPSLLQSMELTLAEVRATLAQVQGLIDEAGPGVVATMDNMQQATHKLAEATSRLDGWMAANDSEMSAFMSDGLGQVPALVEDARNAIRELEKLLQNLRENPSGVVYKRDDDAVRVEE